MTGAKRIMDNQQEALDSFILRRLADYYTPEDAQLWLDSKHNGLHGERPCDLIAEGRSGEVLNLLDRLDAGNYL